jgi:hypothetical protein
LSSRIGKEKGMTDKWRHRKIRSFRVSEALESLIKAECQRRGTSFSSFMRYAAVAVMPNRNQTMA